MILDPFKHAAHREGLTAASNKIAVILAGNTPFYPLYLYFILGRAGLPWLLFSGVSLPFFIATLALARRRGIVGRVWLCGVATLNSVYVTWLLGEASGTALFLLPCTVLALLSFRRRELVPLVMLSALPGVMFLLLHGHFPAPPALYSFAQYHSLQVLNEISVVSISVVLVYVFWKTRDE
jgi:hypothetical protein